MLRRAAPAIVFIMLTLWCFAGIGRASEIVGNPAELLASSLWRHGPSRERICSLQKDNLWEFDFSSPGKAVLVWHLPAVSKSGPTSPRFTLNALRLEGDTFTIIFPDHSLMDYRVASRDELLDMMRDQSGAVFAIAKPGGPFNLYRCPTA